MAKIGSFGVDRELEDNTFEYFGVEMRVNALAGEQAYIDFIETAGELDDRDPRAAIAVKNFMREIVHPDDFDVFWSLSRTKRQDTAELFRIAEKVIEAVAGHPTQQSSGSSPGLSATGPSSTAASYSERRRELEAAGRPELSLIYLDAEEAGVAS